MALQNVNAARDGSHGVGMFGVSIADNATIIGATFDNATQRLRVDASVSPPTGFSSFAGATATVASSGTAVQLANHACSQVIIVANSSNGGVVYVGGSDVKASSKNGLELQPTASVELNLSNTNLAWIDSTNSGDTISYTYLS